MAFPSVYEMTNPLTTVRKQHFWEYFSGSKLPMPSSVYSQTTENDHVQIAQSPSTEDSRAGQKITSASNGMVGNTLNELTVKLSNPYSTTAGYNVFAVVWDSSGSVRSTSDTISVNSITNSPTWTDYTFSFSSPVTVNNGDVVGVTSDGGTHSSSSVIVKVNTSNVDSTSTFYTYRNGAWFSTHFGSNADMYLIAITGSNARWTTNDITGTNTFAMKDAVDGGFQITTSGGNGDQGSITFNDIRQYSPTGSTIIGVVKFDETTIDGAFGLSNSNLLGSSHSVLWNESTETNFKLSTSGTGARTETDTSVVRDTSTRTVKIVNGSSDVNMYFDNVLVSTISSPDPLPNASMQPIFYLKTQSAATKTGHITYCEAYNT